MREGTLYVVVDDLSPLLALRVEYLKARARKERYREETLLVQEEKRATLASLQKEALLWDRREGTVLSLKVCPVVAEGASAYAAERAASERALSAKFSTMWGTISVSTEAQIQADRSHAVEEVENVELAASTSVADADDELHFTAAADIDSDDEAGDLQDDSDEE